MVALAMTSATEPGRMPKAPTRPAACRRRGYHAANPSRRAGLTLVELLLALLVLLMLFAAVVGTFSNWYEHASLPAAARQYEGILRLARAEAASSGRRIRMSFDPETLQPRMLWEPNPLAEPGMFVPYPGDWAHRLPTDLVRVSRCQRTGSSALQMLVYEDTDELESEDGNILQPLTFYPDGSCDSAIIELIGADESELRVGVIRLDGESGVITLHVLTPAELEEFHEEAESS